MVKSFGWTEDRRLGTVDLDLPPALGTAALSWSIAATTTRAGTGTSAALAGRWTSRTVAVALRLVAAALLPTAVTRAVSRSLA